MSPPLADRVALVTGATGGIGSAICQRLAAAGAAVVVAYRSSGGEAEALARALPGTGHSVAWVEVADSDSLEALAGHVVDRHGRLDILVNSAGFTRFVDHTDLEGSMTT